LLELVKIFIPAILSSFLITFYFQKRLARIGDFKEITAELMRRLQEGTERVYKLAQKLNQHIELLRDRLATELIERDELLKLKENIYQSGEVFFESLEEHRIYILSIIPFGGSSTLRNAVLAIVGYSESLSDFMPAGEENEEKQRELLLKLQAEIRRWTSSYNSLRTAIQDSQKCILEGKLP
jgi:signal transduction histidine kinase